MTLLDVEVATDGTAAARYIAKLEAGEIELPAPHVLYVLAGAYIVPYEKLMELAGHIRRRGAIGPSSTDYDAWLANRHDLLDRFRDRTFSIHSGYEIWRNAWLACEKEHGLRKEAKT